MYTLTINKSMQILSFPIFFGTRTMGESQMASFIGAMNLVVCPNLVLRLLHNYDLSCIKYDGLVE